MPAALAFLTDRLCIDHARHVSLEPRRQLLTPIGNQSSSLGQRAHIRKQRPQRTATRRERPRQLDLPRVQGANRAGSRLSNIVIDQAIKAEIAQSHALQLLRYNTSLDADLISEVLLFALLVH